MAVEAVVEAGSAEDETGSDVEIATEDCSFELVTIGVKEEERNADSSTSSNDIEVPACSTKTLPSLPVVRGSSILCPAGAPEILS
ncbi:unnamed protein product [Protopolystoma xenopodis]|uniref:Uncharacterized protein n=1 Tax=Protopolystoma xenopodis TaxID=117903 RepID=A0A3S5CPB3_9PLAT|nr:unnamed protein product [Protopolystoma xenopodis]